jgi:hypothetical protein
MDAYFPVLQGIPLRDWGENEVLVRRKISSYLIS